MSLPQHDLVKDTCKCVFITRISCMQIFDEELAEVEQRVRLIAAAGADAVIVQVCAHGLAQHMSACHKQVVVSVSRLLLTVYTHVIRWTTCCTAR